MLPCRVAEARLGADMASLGGAEAYCDAEEGRAGAATDVGALTAAPSAVEVTGAAGVA